MQVQTQHIRFKQFPNIVLDIRREDLIHPMVSGNKFRKLKYNLQEAKIRGAPSVLTFGGAYSNHILATAYAGKVNGLQTIGVVRGDELESKMDDNPTLSQAKVMGMEFYFISREEYRQKDSATFLEHLNSRFNRPYIIPEGGTNTLAVQGCQEILVPSDQSYDYICSSVGTGGTLAGLIEASSPEQFVLGFSSLKGQGLQEDISKFVTSENWEINFGYHFGGYAKINEELIAFINAFKSDFGIPLDPVYTGKMMFGIIDLIQRNYFPANAKILAIHTGGLQGIMGMNQRLKRQNKPQINV